MRKTPHDMQRLCEGWWQQLAHATREQHDAMAQQFLSELGWGEPCPVACPARSAAAVKASTACLSYLVRKAPPALFAAHFAPPGKLEPPSNLVERGLDFCPTTRALVSATAALDFPYAFITDFCRFYLYDVRSEALLAYADAPRNYPAEFGELLSESAATPDAFDEVRRQPRSFVARQLRDWMGRWVDHLSLNHGVAEKTAKVALDRLLFLRNISEQGLPRRPGWRAARGFYDLMVAASEPDTQGLGDAFVRLTNSLGRSWNAGLFAEDADFAEVFRRDEVTVPLLREFGLLARSKFSMASILESFNYGEAAEKARVRMIPEANPQRTTMMAKQTPATIDELRFELDVVDEGYRAIVHWFDKLVGLYEKMAMEYEVAQRKPPRTDMTAPGFPQAGPDGDADDMDLFDWSEQQTGQPGAIQDPFEHALGQGLIVYCNSERQFRVARLMLYLHLARLYKQKNLRLTQFPPVDTALKPRPSMLEGDRQFIMNGPREEEWDVV